MMKSTFIPKELRIITFNCSRGKFSHVIDAKLPRHKIERAIRKLKNSPNEEGDIKEYVISNRDLTISLFETDIKTWYPLQAYNYEMGLLVSSPEIKKKIPGKSIVMYFYTNLVLSFMSRYGMDGRTIRGKYSLCNLYSGYRASLILKNPYDSMYTSAIELGNALSEKPRTITRTPGHWYLKDNGESFVYLDRVENAICGGYSGVWNRNNELYSVDGDMNLFNGDQLEISGDVTINLNIYNVATEKILGDYYKKPLKDFMLIQNNTKYFPDLLINPKSRMRCVDMGEYFIQSDIDNFKSIYSSLITPDLKTSASRKAALLFPKDPKIDKDLYKKALLKKLKSEILAWRSTVQKSSPEKDSIEEYKRRSFDNFTYKCLLHNLILNLSEDEVDAYIKKFW